MTENNDPIEMMGDAMKDVRRDFMEKFIRPMRAEVVNRPLLGVKVPKEQRRADFHRLRDDPASLSSQYDFLVERYKVPQGMIPRRLVDYLAAGQKEFGKEEE